MTNKGFVTVLTIVVSTLCVYYLSFTLISRGVQQDAAAYATDQSGEVDPEKKQRYLDSVWHKPVFNFLGIKDFTYEQIKNSEISLGLDLQGGMHVTLEVSPVDIIMGLSGNNQDSAFVKALHQADIEARTSQQSFTTLFVNAYNNLAPGKRLAPLFTSANTGGRIGLSNTDAEVIRVLDDEIEKALNRSYTILSKRIDQFGTSSPNIQRLPGRNQIQIEIPGAENPQRVRKLLSGVARLEFWDVVEPSTIQPSLIAINDMLVKEQQAASARLRANQPTAPAEESPEASQDTTLTDLERQLQSAASDTSATSLDSLTNMSVSPLFSLAPSGMFRYLLRDTAAINDILSRPDVRGRLPRNVGVYWAAKPDKITTSVTEEPRLQLYFLDLGRNRTPKLDGQSIVTARQDLDERAQPAVSMTMNSKGTQIWAKWTAEAARAGSRIAIVLDDFVYSAPGVNEEIPFGNSIIQGNFTIEEAQDLASILQAGSLPATPRIVEEAVVGPSLGQESIQNGLISIVVGFLVIILFMFATYNNAGWVADAAVVLNLLFLMGVLASLNAALTLPGIAGILLSLAIAVDANVLINERVKEDLNDGKPIQMAITNGYKNAFWAIFDSNVTTLIKGVVLLTFGTGLIFGFAVTLVIGILCSFFTAVFFTRLIFERIARKGKTISFSWGWSKNIFRNININFIGQRKLYYGISGAIIVAGMVSLAMKGFNYGVDFKGGRTYVVGFNQSVDIEELRNALEVSFGTSPEVKTYGFDNKYQVTTGYRIDDPTEEATNDAHEKLEAGLQNIPGDGQILKFTKVGPTVAADTRVSAVYALAIAMGLMFLYILLRFRKWQFAFGTMVSLVHTVLVVVSLFSLLEGVMPFALEVDQAFVAAILTVIGYSINDSVVVFDRVREFLRDMKSGEHMPTVINNALNDTLSRTLITGMSTIFVIIILFTFGGETIKGFTFAMLIGVLIGTYSSICIGTPVLVDFSGTKPEKGKLEPAPAKA